MNSMFITIIIKSNVGWGELGFFPSYKGYASKNLIKISMGQNWEWDCNPFTLLTFLMCQKVLLYV